MKPIWHTISEILKHVGSLNELMSTQSLTEIEKSNPFLTSKVIRKPNTKDCRVIFLYPNERGMSTVPPSIATLSQILKDEDIKQAFFSFKFFIKFKLIVMLVKKNFVQFLSYCLVKLITK